MSSWIAVDWGTTRLRAWRMSGAGPVAAAASEAGMAGLAPDAFEPALLDLIGPWLARSPGRTLVLACGMVGARQGWIEAPYGPVPGPALGTLVRAPAGDPRLDVRVLPGLAQRDPPDVMRGEETQLAGLLAEEPEFAGLVCLPGTHTKWAELGEGRVLRFSTFMTGELFGLLARHSVLRHSVGSGWDEAAFADGLALAEAGTPLAAGLFSLRAASLIEDLPPAAARARLSGLLLGAEVAAMAPRIGAAPVTIVGDAGLARLYELALTRAGARPTVQDGERVTLAGLAAARAALEGEPGGPP